MPLNILDMQDASLGARRKVQSALREFEMRFNQPLIDTQLNVTLGAIAKKIDPKAAKQIDELFTGGAHAED